MSDMNNNVKDNKKNPFKRLSSFKKFLIIYASALIVIIAAALVILHGFLKDYESGRPANTMDTLVAHIEREMSESGLRKVDYSVNLKQKV